jgi:hypothetical protein
MNESLDIKKEVRSRTFGYISAALGLVAGLAWNDAISVLINTLFPLAKETILIKFLYAVLVTVVVVILIQYLERLINRGEDKK